MDLREGPSLANLLSIERFVVWQLLQLDDLSDMNDTSGTKQR